MYFDRNNLSLYDIHRFLSILLTLHSHPAYEADVHNSILRKFKQEVHKRGKKKKVGHYEQERGEETSWQMREAVDKTIFQDPFNELFIWAILSKRTELLELFWQRSSRPVLMSVMAGTMLDKISKLYYAGGTMAPVLKLKEHFMEGTNELLEIGFELDRQKMLS